MDRQTLFRTLSTVVFEIEQSVEEGSLSRWRIRMYIHRLNRLKEQVSRILQHEQSADHSLHEMVIIVDDICDALREQEYESPSLLPLSNEPSLERQFTGRIFMI